MNLDNIIDRRNPQYRLPEIRCCGSARVSGGYFAALGGGYGFSRCPACHRGDTKTDGPRYFRLQRTGSGAVLSCIGAVVPWFREQHHWQIQQDWLLQTPGVVFALAMAVKAFTDPGDAVLIQQPVYYPFSEVILDNGRRRVSSDLVLKDGHYEIDFTDFEQKIIENRVWTREELETVAGICHKHNVIVVADEIHEDFVWTERPHIPYATLGETFAQQAVICTAPSKTFNLAGLQVSNIFIPNYELRRKVRHEINAAGYSQLNTLGLVACEAAYQYGLPWLKEVKQYLRENINFTRAFLQQHIPQISLIEPEGTYLLWLDCRGLGLTNTELEELIVNKAGLWLDNGAIFGAAGKGFQRVNAACPRSVLREALERIQKAISC